MAVIPGHEDYEQLPPPIDFHHSALPCYIQAVINNVVPAINVI